MSFYLVMMIVARLKQPVGAPVLGDRLPSRCMTQSDPGVGG
ncbi:hypothetical protein [Gemmatimonas sp.]